MGSARTRFIVAAAMLVAVGFTPMRSAHAQMEPFVGQIMYVGFNFCPKGWAQANGQLLPISQNTALFSLLGTYYGGDGQSTFGLPDLRGRVPVHMGTGAGLSEILIGQKGGSERLSLTFAQMPAHAHTATTSIQDLEVTSVLRGSTASADTASPAGASLAMPKKEAYSSGSPTTDMAGGSVQSTVSGGTATTTVAATNSGTDSVPVRDPYLGMTACIALFGIYPSRE